MGRLNTNISNHIDKEMREFIKINDLTITTFLHLAITNYLETQANAKQWENFFTELFTDTDYYTDEDEEE